MGYAPKRPCTHPGCRMLTTDGRCPKHPPSIRKREVDQHRAGSAERGYGWRWRKAREGFLRHHPLCKMCQAVGVVRAATDVDHIVPHRGDKTIFWDSSNWQPLCHGCHSSKTARKDGGFNNRSTSAASLSVRGWGVESLTDFYSRPR